MLISPEEMRAAVELAIAPLCRRIEALTQKVSELEQKLEGESQPDIVGQQRACELLDCSDRTLQRWRSDWMEGVHWWKAAGSDRPLYNLPLIRDGQRQGFDSPAHLMECRQWAKAQSQQRRKAG